MRISDWSSDVCSSDLRDHIWEVYGATEGLVRCWIGGREWLERPGSVGRPIGGGRLRILRADGQECEAGEEGEVFATPPGGAGSAHRYLGADPRATADGRASVDRREAGWGTSVCVRVQLGGRRIPQKTTT